MAKTRQGDGVTTRRATGSTTGPVAEDRSVHGHGTPSPDEDLHQASIQDLHEFADELQIEGYESMTREELVREIRRETRAEA
jgi:hypothetical protein